MHVYSSYTKETFTSIIGIRRIYLKDVESHKHIGVPISSNLLWNLQINEIIFKAYALSLVK